MHKSPEKETFPPQFFTVSLHQKFLSVLCFAVKFPGFLSKTSSRREKQIRFSYQDKQAFGCHATHPITITASLTPPGQSLSRVGNCRANICSLAVD
jgi:hypothetical protein